MSNIKPMKLYLYGMFCEVSSVKPSGFPKVNFEWSRECRLGYEDEDGYWIPNTTFRLDHGDGYEWWNVVYNPDGYGSIFVESLTLDPNCMEEFKEKAMRMAFRELILQLDKFNQKEKKDGDD